MRNYADAEGARMRYRFATLPLMLALAAPSLGAQDSATRANSRVESPPELEVLAQAVEAITTMHMDGFSDTTLWEAALDGLKGLVRDISDETLSEAQADLLSVVEQARRSAEPEILAQTVARISRLSVDGVSDSTLWEAAIDGLIGALDDPYAELFTEVESDAWEEETTGNYSGIGLQITLLNEEVTVTAVFRSTPANQVGIIVGDIIVGVNTNDASDWTTGMAADSIRGPVGTDVLVKIKRAGFDEPIGFDITRAQVHVPAVHYGVLESNIGYVLLDRVARNAAQEMNSALAELADTRGLVIDLRRNPGGFLDESLMLADLFLKPGSTLASTVQRRPNAEAYETETDSFEDRWPQLVPDLPIVILVDRFTASGAEILAGALQDYDRALVLGERSFGKGVVQTVMRLPYSRRLRFTTGSWHTPLGRSLQRARDSQFRPIAEDLDTFPRVNTAQGRSLINGGGIFPDLALADDTTTLVERELIRAVNEQKVPLGLRLAELGFEAAGARRDEGTEDPALTDEEFDGFIARLVEEGLSEDQLSDEGVRTYLRWRGRITVAQRMDDLGAEADIRMERDPVLSEAVRLLLNSTTQVQLFEAAEAEQARRDEGTGEL
ncbi:MAG: S41 family peptidase [Gemmatimonadetes bacterium]|jgi:carboxyl-terminal processing protease|nr:S41 family peptidase [Gemmatimonadota bacterium]